MKTFTMTMTKRGQITIPAEIRQKLGLKPGDNVVFRVDGDSVTINPAKWTLESVFRSVTPINCPEDFEQLIREAKEERATKYIQGVG
jgi:antitoxin PrlF